MENTIEKKEKVTILSKLGSGFNNSVYLGELNGQRYAIKAYKQKENRDKDYNMLEFLKTKNTIPKDFEVFIKDETKLIIEEKHVFFKIFRRELHNRYLLFLTNLKEDKQTKVFPFNNKNFINIDFFTKCNRYQKDTVYKQIIQFFNFCYNENLSINFDYFILQIKKENVKVFPIDIGRMKNENQTISKEKFKKNILNLFIKFLNGIDIENPIEVKNFSELLNYTIK